MADRLFISHAIEDAATANRIVDYLEAKGVSCWIATRDIPARALYAEAITKGMQQCSACAVIVSDAANKSKGVVRELELASHFDRDFIPIRIDGVEPGAGLDYYLRSAQWIDYGRDGERALDKIAAAQPVVSAEADAGASAQTREREYVRTEPSQEAEQEEHRPKPEPVRKPKPLLQKPPALLNTLTRLRDLIVSPTREWPRIAAEQKSVQSILLRHVLPLSALQGLAVGLGVAFYGGATETFPNESGPYAIMMILLAIAGACVHTLVAGGLASVVSHFTGPQASYEQGFKLIAYSATPMWLGGLAAIFPPAHFIVWIGIAYAFVLLFFGLGPVLRPTKRVLAYAAIATGWIITIVAVAYVNGLLSYELLFY